jgi:vesicle coat complex subunit
MIMVVRAWRLYVQLSSKLQYLYVEGNQIGDQGAIALSQLLLKTTKPILEIIMVLFRGSAKYFWGPTKNKVKAPPELDGNTALKNLFVDNNNIGKEGSKRLASALNSATAMGDGLGD